MGTQSRSDILRGMPLVLVGMLLGALALAPASAGTGNLATKKFVKKQIKKLAYTKAAADARFQEACTDGTVLGFATVVPNTTYPSAYTTQDVTGFNCAGGAILARRTGPGKYFVRFEGLLDGASLLQPPSPPICVGCTTVGTSHWGIGDADVVTWVQNDGGATAVFVYTHNDGGANDFGDFSVAVLGVA